MRAHLVIAPIMMARFGVVITVVLQSLHAASSAALEQFPIYPEQFTVATREFSSSGEQVLNQTLWWDMTARRTRKCSSVI